MNGKLIVKKIIAIFSIAHNSSVYAKSFCLDLRKIEFYKVDTRKLLATRDGKNIAFLTVSACIKNGIAAFLLFTPFLVLSQQRLDFNLLKPDRSIVDGYLDGKRERQEAERRQFEIEAIRLQNQQKRTELEQEAENRRKNVENQTRRQTLEKKEEVSKQQNQPEPNASSPVIDEWLRAAAPRMGLYADFEQTVFATDVPITLDMIRLMTPSPLAADIAYYLATHKMESLAISKMTLAESARAIDRIEAKLKTTQLP